MFNIDESRLGFFLLDAVLSFDEAEEAALRAVLLRVSEATSTSSKFVDETKELSWLFMISPGKP